eukprot:6911785-Pyramimonas_sp.AAC.1
MGMFRERRLALDHQRRGICAPCSHPGGFTAFSVASRPHSFFVDTSFATARRGGHFCAQPRLLSRRHMPDHRC